MFRFARTVAAALSCGLVASLALAGQEGATQSPGTPPPATSSAASPPAARPPAEWKHPPLKCRIGKPSYCGKYGGLRCRKTNHVPDPATACDAWTEACLACHRDIPACFGSARPLSGTPRCAQCGQQWHDCMRRADTKHWPSRLEPTPED